MPALQVLQKKYSKTGKFMFIASEVQGSSKKSIEQFMAKNKYTFPVYQQLNLSFAKCGRGIPHKVLIDHKGNVIASGHIQDLEGQIKKLIAAAPESGGGSSMLGDVEVKHHASLAKRLVPGKPVKSSLDSLLNKSKGTDAAAGEAKKIYDAVIKWGKDGIQTAQKSSKTAPSAAYMQFEMLGKTFRGYDWAKDTATEMKTLTTTHKTLKYFNNIVLGVQRDEEREKLDAKRAKSIIYSLNSYIKKYKPSGGLETEANALLKKLDEI
jgi:hypothetical protein